MDLYVVFAQRKCRYEGEYAPEALDIVDEYSWDENPDWLDERVQKAKENPDYVSVEVITIALDEDAFKAIDHRLNGSTTVKGTVKPTS